MPAEDETKAADVSSHDGVPGAIEKGPEVVVGKHDAPKTEPPEADDFGLPVRPPRRRQWDEEEDERNQLANGVEDGNDDSDAFEDAPEKQAEEDVPVRPAQLEKEKVTAEPEPSQSVNISNHSKVGSPDTGEKPTEPDEATGMAVETNGLDKTNAEEIVEKQTTNDQPEDTKKERRNSSRPSSSHSGRPHAQSVGASEWSHQQLAPQTAIEEEDDDGDGDWKEMPALATHRIYDDWGKVLAKEYGEVDDEHVAYGTLGGAGKGYTRVQDDDAESVTSMDDNTAYLFKEPHITNTLDDDEEGRDQLSQMQATKELLTEGQRIAYVGVVRLSIGKMLGEISELEKTKGTKKQIEMAIEAMKMWGQKMMVRLYGHMDIDSAEQVMVEQLAEHGVLPGDLTPALMQNARVKNPVKPQSETSSISSARPSMSSPRPSSTAFERQQSSQNLSAPQTPQLPSTPPPAYEEHTAADLTIQNPADLERGAKDLDIDIRWTILCDLFLILIADSTYDARSRTLLEHVGSFLSVPWQEVCRFEKRVTDALEMQEQADKENWNEEEHMESRKKASMKKRMMVMGLCTVGGGLVIGLSAGLLAPVIGAGLAAGFTTIGITGTSTFLAGTGAAALIGTTGTLTGGVIAVRASNRRTGAVKTFEYKPLFNNKRTNLIVTVSGWMTGKVDDVRLPFSTVDPIMGDIYSVNWEPEMLQSTGQTIQILATEALTQTIQQILASTVLTGLMAGLSAPIILTKLSYLIDNPWTVSCARADATGLILADSLIDRNLGVRPITLVGFSLGSRVIFSCLKELARRGALGLVQNAYLFGSPVVAKKEEYMRARTVVSGRFVNGYATNDWILGYLFRATSGGIARISGLTSVDGVPGIENKDFSELVPGHMAYRAMMPKLLEECGWAVDGLEFSEIEDPDPENHEKRQRELINEIEAARHVLEEGGQVGEKKSGFKAFFSRKKVVKKEWEKYDERSQKVLEGSDSKEAERIAAESEDVMFDVDAIRAEALKLALQGEDVEEIKKHLQVKEIASTLPALRVSSSSMQNGGETPPRPTLSQTKSYDEPNATRRAESNEAPVVVNGHSGNNEETPHLSPPTAEDRPSTSPGPSTGQTTPDKSSYPERPPLKSVATAPKPEVKDPNHNPWADEDDLEFGRERDVQMSFE